MPFATNILIVEDNPADRKLMDIVLRGVAIDVVYVFAGDGFSALEILNKGIEDFGNELPDFIILDQNMPRMDGYALLKEIKGDKRLKNIPVALFSTSPIINVEDPDHKYKADAYIAKPFEFEEYERVIHELCLRWIKEKKL
jgi:CheY-like chemotaxis protein